MKNQDKLLREVIVKNTFKIESHRAFILELLSDYKTYNFDMFHAYDNRMPVTDTLSEWVGYLECELEKIHEYIGMLEEIKAKGQYFNKFTSIELKESTQDNG